MLVLGVVDTVFRYSLLTMIIIEYILGETSISNSQVY